MTHPEFRVILDKDGPPPEEPLLVAYGGPLKIRRQQPSLVGNFVATVDGVVAFGGAAGEGAGAVSLHSRADRYVMALLRSAADVVLIGASTLRDDLHHQWTAATVMPDLSHELARFRERITGSSRPVPLAVVTGSGRLPPGHPALSTPKAQVLILTTELGRRHLPPLHDSVRVCTLAEAGEIATSEILARLRSELTAVTVLSEGGPRLFGQLLADDAVDELFLTVAPHLAGNTTGAPRPGLAAGVLFPPGATPRLNLLSLRLAGDHLFLRYGVVRTESNLGQRDSNAAEVRPTPAPDGSPPSGLGQRTDQL